jgi:hypothetical protein
MDEIALWEQVHCCFDEDDGSLPSVAIESLSASEVGLIFEAFTREGRVTTEEPVFHDQQTDQMLPLNSVSNAAKLVGDLKASPFHLAFGGVTSNGQELPELGVLFFQDSIAVDYRMGKAWDSTKVLAFFTWLKHLVGLTESGKVVACTSDGPPSPEKFDAAWQAFLPVGL